MKTSRHLRQLTSIVNNLAVTRAKFGTQEHKEKVQIETSEQYHFVAFLQR